MTATLDMIRGRANIVPLTNNSGGALVAGDVCIQDTTGNEYITTTTSAASVAKVFIAAESIANGAIGKFYATGYCPLVTPSASVTRGRYLFTHTVAKQAAESATYGVGAFGVILTSGATPSVWLFGSTAQGSGGGVARSGSTTDGHLAVWNGANADSIKDGGAVPTGTIGGSTGSTDNAIIRADGTGGVTIQASSPTIDDSGSIDIPTGQTYKINGTAHTHSTSYTGYAPYAFHLGVSTDEPFGQTISLAAVSGGNGGALACPIKIDIPINLDTLVVRNTDGGATTRSAEWRLFAEPAGGGSTLNEVASANGTWSFTTSGANNRASQLASPPLLINPGLYWLVIRNTSTTQTFTVATNNAGVLGQNHALTKAIAALGSTIDMSSGWSKSTHAIGVVLQGRVHGASSLF